MMRFPDSHGLAGKGWNVSPTEHPYTLASWFMLAPGAHPLWDWYFVNVHHLRGEINGKAANLHYPEAEYEIVVFALDPNKPNPIVDAPLSDGSLPVPFLNPVNLSKQFHGIGDNQAIEPAHLLVNAYVIGALNPDSDGRGEAEKAIDKTIEHFQGKCDCGCGEVVDDVQLH